MPGPLTLPFPTEPPFVRTADRWILHADGRDVAPSNLEKPFWPDEGITQSRRG